MKILSVPLAAFAAAVLLTGCSSAGAAPKSAGVKSYDQAVAEYNAAKATLTLPPGVGTAGWGKPLLAVSDGNPVQYQDGAATGRVQLAWLCSWEKEWLAQRGNDAARTTKAITEIEGFTSMQTYTTNFDAGSREYFDKELAAAKLGDPSLIQQDVVENCG